MENTGEPPKTGIFKRLTQRFRRSTPPQTPIDINGEENQELLNDANLLNRVTDIRLYQKPSTHLPDHSPNPPPPTPIRQPVE